MPELDEATKATLRREATALVVEHGMDLRQARQIVWQDYLDELRAAEPAPTAPDPPPALVPAPPPASPVRHQWYTPQAPAPKPHFTPERLESSRQHIKRIRQQLLELKRNRA